MSSGKWACFSTGKLNSSFEFDDGVIPRTSFGSSICWGWVKRFRCLYHFVVPIMRSVKRLRCSSHLVVPTILSVEIQLNL